MQSPAAEQTGAEAADADQGLIQDESARAREELRMLFIGFGTGMAIAGVFLLYIILEAGKYLP